MDCSDTEATEAYECPICKVEMNVKPFEQSDSDHVVDDAFRLECGHAYHGICILQHFRHSPSCPVCRAQSQNGSNLSAGEAMLITEDGTNVVFPLTSVLQQLNDQVQNEHLWEDLQNDQELRDLRNRNRQVKIARRELKNRRKEINVLSNQLRQEKKQVLSAALRDWKQQRYSQYQDSFIRFQQAHDAVKRIEQNEFDHKHGENAMQGRSWFSVYSATEAKDELRLQSPFGESTRRNDPTQRGFWSY